MTGFKGKCLVFTAPSGAGKTTIVRHLLQVFPQLDFSVSATSRAQRPGEIHGRDYYFLTEADFRQKISEQAFLEWEEVYRGQFYGTLKSEVERLWAEKKHIIFDIDVQGALSIKREYGDDVLTVFVQPPSMEALTHRLEQRRTETPESIARRLGKAEEEMQYAPQFDRVLINDELEVALSQAEDLTRNFLNV